MEAKTKKALAIAGATALGLTLFFAYRQYKKIMSYTVKVVGKKIYKLSAREIVFDLFVSVNNFANIPIIMKSQMYDIYLNNNFITRVSSDKKTEIKANSSTTIPLRVNIRPQDVVKAIGSNWAGLLLQPEKVIITIVFELKASLWGIGIPIRNSYPVSLAELTKSQQNQPK